MVAFGWSHQLAASSHPQYKRPRTCIVGMAGFEPATPCSQSRCATKLRYIPCCFVLAGLQVCSPGPRSPLFCWLYNKGPKSKPDAVSRWKGDFQRFRYLSVCPVQERGYVGMLFSRRQNHTQTPDGANVDFRSATPYVIPDHGVRRILLIREAGARS